MGSTTLPNDVHFVLWIQTPEMLLVVESAGKHSVCM